MPRGSGKTSLCLAAVQWAVLSGRRRYVVLISADEGSAIGLLRQIKIDLSHNELLAGDYPECCYPLSRIQGISQRQKGQTLDGVPTCVDIGRNRLVLPTIAGSPSSGSVIEVRGLTASIRGMSHKLQDGQTLRPDLCLLDDPQTDESAKSPSQCTDREALINGAVMGLAGPSKRIACLAALTVIRQDDLADRLLNRELNPEWQGVRHQLAKSLPDRLDLWDEYGQIRSQALRDNQPVSIATEFYQAHRAEMDRGCVPSWYARHNEDEISAVQNIMNLRLRNQYSFAAEYQNRPITQDLSTVELTQADLAGKLSYIPHRIVPDRCTRLTMGVDVQGNVLYWLVIASEENNTQYIIDYGCYPEQRREYFLLREVKNTLQKKLNSQDLATCLFGGLSQLVEGIRPYVNQAGIEVPMGRILIDAAWGASTDAVRRFCERYQRSKPVMPAFGKFVKASQTVNEPLRPRPGDRGGLGWRIPKPTNQVRHVLFDTNIWKSETAKRLRMIPGSPGSLSLYGSDPTKHKMIADHLLSHRSTIVTVKDLQVEEWSPIPGRDDHWLDCLSLASVAASIEGINSTSQIETPTVSQQTPAKSKRVKLSDIARKKIEAYQGTR